MAYQPDGPAVVVELPHGLVMQPFDAADGPCGVLDWLVPLVRDPAATWYILGGGEAQADHPGDARDGDGAR